MTNWIALVAFPLILTGCGEEGYQDLYLNLYPLTIGETDPFAGVSRLEAALEDGTDRWELGPLNSTADFGPLRRCAGCRIEVSGLSSGSRLSWGFSPSLYLGGGAVKTTLCFTPDTAAVAHAGPLLVDPDGGLAPYGVPLSFTLEGARGSIAYNRNYLYVDVRVDDDAVIPNDDKWYRGDLVVLAVDGMADSTAPGSRDDDDVVLAFGAASFARHWYLQPSQDTPSYPLLYDFNQRPEGYDVFAAIPLNSLTVDETPGPSWSMKLGVFIIDVDSSGGEPVTTRAWPPGFDPRQGSQDPEPTYCPSGAGDLILKPRPLDARKVSAGAVSLGEGIGDFLPSGAVPLSRRPDACEDDIRVYALWDSNALMLAIESADEVFCTRQLLDGDRESLIEFDAVEVTVVPDPYTQDPEPVAYRAVFGPAGATAFDRPGAGAWEPGEVYFRFDLDGPRPSDDCREGRGYTFWVRIPWTNLGYLAAPPATGEVLGFDLAVYDNDRGARSQAAFSPMGPTEDLEALAELRLFEY
jgi:hypothetical protein